MEGAQMGFKTPHPLPIYLAAHGPKLMAFGVQRADGILTYMATRSHNEQSRKVIGPDKKLLVVQPCLIEEDAEKARKWARRAVSIYSRLRITTGPGSLRASTSQTLIPAGAIVS
jgi:alkanesulfonate monooxygenase SsuD/methylene tetrahydromethanopterin reductase-like flavin-dependent oxidoreductase (luciferase family)